MFQIPDHSLIPWWYTDLKNLLALPLQLLLAGLVSWVIQKLGGIHALVNSNLSEQKRMVAVLKAQLAAAGIEPDLQKHDELDEGRSR